MEKDQIIVLRPGQQITIQSLPALPPQVTDDDESRILPVPYLSQNSPTAARSPGDCGPDCIAMAVAYFTDQTPTVDEVAQACGQDPGSHWSNFYQLALGARAYNITAAWTNPITPDLITSEIQARRPIIALINYSKDPRRQDKDYREAHFWLVVGYSPTHVIVHDPDRISGDFGEFRRITWSIFLLALETTHELPSNKHSNHGMILNG